MKARKFFDIRAGVNFSREKDGYESDGEEKFLVNVGSDKYDPGGPSCTYKEGKVTCHSSCAVGLWTR